MLKKVILGVLSAPLLPMAGNSLAQSSYPEQTVRILVGFSPGVAPDVTARLLADKLTEAWGKPVVVENVTGAGGNIAAARLAKAAPDGTTLGMVGNGTLVFSPSMVEKLAFDPVKDFAPIARVFVAANVLVVPNEVPAKTLPELVALARAQPGKLSYAHAGAGTSQHLAAELFKSMARLDIQPVAYRGTTALLPDLLAGRVTMAFGNVVNVLPLVREGKLRAFAVTSVKRSGIAPDLPTMAESGYPGFEAVPWFGLMAPSGISPGIVDKVHRDTVKILATPDLRKKFGDLGLDVIGDSPAEFAAVIERETPQWARVIKQAGIKAGE
ncbi:MAG TPA: tripartite tricarboxylate transporter substrate binding protein [Candidatus Limnocylindrales bacterium]|nr:tripartite tricarboxylate transporter substrate binding protein [Candidatus Limnocylindrales bacterium]